MTDPGCTSLDGNTYFGEDSVITYDNDGNQSCTTLDNYGDE